MSADRIYEVALRPAGDMQTILVVARRLSDGAVLRRYPVQRHYQVDIAGARVTKATPTFIEVESSWLVLD